MTPDQYRQHHPRCRYCRYKKLIQPPLGVCSDYYKCLVKDKIISEVFWNWRGMLCLCYKPEELDFEI